MNKLSKSKGSIEVGRASSTEFGKHPFIRKGVDRLMTDLPDMVGRNLKKTLMR